MSRDDRGSEGSGSSKETELVVILLQFHQLLDSLGVSGCYFLAYKAVHLAPVWLREQMQDQLTVFTHGVALVAGIGPRLAQNRGATT